MKGSKKITSEYIVGNELDVIYYYQEQKTIIILRDQLHPKDIKHFRTFFNLNDDGISVEIKNQNFSYIKNLLFNYFNKSVEYEHQHTLYEINGLYFIKKEVLSLSSNTANSFKSINSDVVWIFDISSSLNINKLPFKEKEKLDNLNNQGIKNFKEIYTKTRKILKP